jgi:hypothetical protein
MFLRFLLLLLLGYLIFRFIKPLLFNPPPNSHVKGGTNTGSDIQKENRQDIEEADFEEIE